MNKTVALHFLLLLLTCCGCANVDEVTLTGPAVHDQLNSKGYVASPMDTVMPVDTVGNALDSVGRP